MGLAVSHAEQSAELLCPFRQVLLTDAYQRRPVMRQHRHALLPDGAWMPFVPYLAGAA